MQSVKRGDLVTVDVRGTYSGKSRPALIVQADEFTEIGSVAVCLLSTAHVDAPLVRLEVEPSESNGLAQACQIMIDKITAVPRSSLGDRIGTLERDAMIRVDRSLALFLGIA